MTEKWSLDKWQGWQLQNPGLAPSPLESLMVAVGVSSPYMVTAAQVTPTSHVTQRHPALRACLF